VYEIEDRAFGRREEAGLVDAGAEISWAIGLAPLGVDPELQNRGIGSEPVRRGLEPGAPPGRSGVVRYPEPFSRF
jgi:predicted N-acetyltransferase YhbS